MSGLLYKITRKLAWLENLLQIHNNLFENNVFRKMNKITSTTFVEKNCFYKRKLFKIMFLNYKFSLMYFTRSAIISRAISNANGPSKRPNEP